MRFRWKYSWLVNEFLKGAALLCVFLSVLAIVFGPEGRRFAGIPLNVLYSTTCLLLCFAFCGLSLARYASQKRVLAQVLERRHSPRE